MKKKRKNIFKWFFGGIFSAIKCFFWYIVYCLLYIISLPFFRCKVKGKNNVSKNDEARVFITNHYEVFGPIVMFLHFPYKFRPWVIDKIMDPESVEKQMSTGIYNNYNWAPHWFKTMVIKMIRGLVLFTMKHAKGIPVSRENIRANIKTMELSVEAIKHKKNILIFPELSYVTKGIGDFQTGFEHIGKYTYQKIGKKISFYPVFISKDNMCINIAKPIVYDPTIDQTEEKEKIITYLKDSMQKIYKETEIDNETIAQRKKRLKQEKLNKKLAKQQRKNNHKQKNETLLNNAENNTLANQNAERCEDENKNL